MDYYNNNDNLLSASKLIAFNTHPKNYKYFKYDKADTKGLQLGSIIDCLLTEPDKFNKRYIISDIDTSSKYYEFAKELSLISKQEEVSEDSILEVRNKIGFDKRLTDKKVIQIYEEHIKPLYLLCISTPITTKETIDQATYDLCMKVVTSIQTNPFTQLESDYEHEYQKTIVWDCLGIKCKSKLDIVSVNHKTKKIRIRDIKTTGYSTLMFKNSYDKYRYDIQAMFYTLAVKCEYPGYEIEGFDFIVESTIFPGTPLVYRMSDKLLEESKVKIDSLVNDLMWHIENDYWDYPRSIYENNGIMLIE